MFQKKKLQNLAEDREILLNLLLIITEASNVLDDWKTLKINENSIKFAAVYC